MADDSLAYLVELGQPHVKTVAARLSDSNPLVRGQIATALGFIGGPEAVAALTAASGESDPEVRQGSASHSFGSRERGCTGHRRALTGAGYRQER